MRLSDPIPHRLHDVRCRQRRHDRGRQFLDGRGWQRTDWLARAEAPVLDRRVVAVGLALLDCVARHQPFAVGREQQASQQHRRTLAVVGLTPPLGVLHRWRSARAPRPTGPG